MQRPDSLRRATLSLKRSGKRLEEAGEVWKVSGSGMLKDSPRKKLGVITGLADRMQTQSIIQNLESFEHHVEVGL